MDTKPTSALEQDTSVYVPLDRIEMIKVTALGVVSGLLVPLLAWLIANYFIQPVFCGSPDAGGVCDSSGVVAYHVSAVVLGLMAVALLANWGVYRPLLIVLGVIISMWGLIKYLSALNGGSWVEFLAFSAVLHGLSYVAFYWILRLRNFPVSVVLTVVGVFVACWALAA